MKNQETAMRIREAILKSGLTQQEVADKAGIGKSSISQYINGTHVPGNKKAGQLAEVLHCDPMWLMGIDVPEETEKQPMGYEHWKKFKDIIDTMTDEEKKSLMNYMNFIISQRK